MISCDAGNSVYHARNLHLPRWWPNCLLDKQEVANLDMISCHGGKYLAQFAFAVNPHTCVKISITTTALLVYCCGFPPLEDFSSLPFFSSNVLSSVMKSPRGKSTFRQQFKAVQSRKYTPGQQYYPPRSIPMYWREKRQLRLFRCLGIFLGE